MRKKEAEDKEEDKGETEDMEECVGRGKRKTKDVTKCGKGGAS